ncbi:cell wall-binding repeat-containing protein [Microbacterium sp. ET2]|uniref:cell wall-binding repeat-containing protein n=1 Tax=Microbacterium albipurpureum TaxID=3050384 RepID=UPI00259C8CD1|nr:cell wall-binding repeat-containing protein [Microbacterium sp. ET2 (Ac-2212)]WJL95098.1 cell wall-binding repeat-containing protein [Microbacterium sp. ET2 (Ac-2212)]
MLSLLSTAQPVSAEEVTAAQLPSLLTQSNESTTPAYSRDRFDHWVDADADGCNTRYEVLIEESTSPVSVGGGCALSGGTWVSPYDGVTATTPAEIEIDHVVALAEAWRSGAWAWDDDQRRAFANDTEVPYALVAASSSANQSKSDHDPAEWLPTNSAYTCEYIVGWVLTKYRWSLSADPAEIEAVRAQLSGDCGATPITLPTVMVGGADGGEPGTGPTLAFDAGVTRLSGVSRYETAVAASSRFDAGVTAAFVATGTDFPDALSAAAAAASLGGPLLLTSPDSLPSAVESEISRLEPRNIYVVGSTGAVSETVASRLALYAPVTRLGGKDRYETGLAISRIFSSSSSAYLATGRNFPDALAASAVAGAKAAPVILVDGLASSVTATVHEELRRLGVTEITIAGSSSGAVSSSIESELTRSGYSVTRSGGRDRYETAVAINSSGSSTSPASVAFIATGADFPDALSAAAIAGVVGAPLYLTSPNCVPEMVRNAITKLSPSARVVMGGSSVVSDAAAENLGCLSSTIPSIVGTPKVGNTLTADAGAWTAGTTLAYAWYVNGAYYGGGNALALSEGLAGRSVAVRVTGSLTGYVTLTQTSRPVTVAAQTPAPQPPGPPANPGNTKNCTDFATWSQAQAWFETYYPHYGDVAQLDGDADGIACESLPGAP